jgi:hypothetical protein
MKATSSFPRKWRRPTRSIVVLNRPRPNVFSTILHTPVALGCYGLKIVGERPILLEE